MPRLDEVDLDAGRLAHICDRCEAEATVDIATLVLGDGLSPEHTNPDIITLPPCGCGAFGFFVRTWEGTDNPVADTPARRAINSLAQHLRDVGRSHPLCEDVHIQEAIDGKAPPLLMEGRRVEDLTGRAAEARARTEHERTSKAEAAILRAAGGDELEAAFLVADMKRAAVVARRIRNRLGLGPSDAIPRDEIEREEAALSAEIATRIGAAPGA